MKSRQKGLRLAVAGLFILIILFVEMLAVTPKGIFVHTRSKAGPFAPGQTRAQVLDRINQTVTIREMALCDPPGRYLLTSRKGIPMDQNLATARVWSARDRKKGAFLFFFKGQTLDQLVWLNDPESNLLFADCDPDLLADPATHLRSQAAYPVHFD